MNIRMDIKFSFQNSQQLKLTIIITKFNCSITLDMIYLNSVFKYIFFVNFRNLPPTRIINRKCIIVSCNTT